MWTSLCRTELIVPSQLLGHFIDSRKSTTSTAAKAAMEDVFLTNKTVFYKNSANFNS